MLNFPGRCFAMAWAMGYQSFRLQRILCAFCSCKGTFCLKALKDDIFLEWTPLRLGVLLVLAFMTGSPLAARLIHTAKTMLVFGHRAWEFERFDRRGSYPVHLDHFGDGSVDIGRGRLHDFGCLFFLSWAG